MNLTLTSIPSGVNFKVIFSFLIAILEPFKGIMCSPSDPNSQSFAKVKMLKKQNINANKIFFITSPP